MGASLLSFVFEIHISFSIYKLQVCPPLIPVESPKFPLSVTYVFFAKFKGAAKRYAEVIIPELFDIYFNVIPHFHMIFNAEFISEAINNFYGFAK